MSHHYTIHRRRERIVGTVRMIVFVLWKVYQTLYLGVTVVLCPRSNKHHYTIYTGKQIVFESNG